MTIHQTVVLTSPVRYDDAAPCMRIRRAQSTVYVYEVPIDTSSSRLTNRAAQLLAAGWYSSAYTSDDLLTTPLYCVRRVPDIETAAGALIEHFGVAPEIAEKVRHRAYAMRKFYGDEPGVETFEGHMPHATHEELVDPVLYVNRLAETRNLAACGDEPAPADARCWSWVLLHRYPLSPVPVA